MSNFSDGQVLNDNAVDLHFVEKTQIIPQLRHFRVCNDDVDSRINAHAEKMCRLYGRAYFLIIQIVRKFPGTEGLAAQVDGVGSRIDCSPHVRK